MKNSALLLLLCVVLGYSTKAQKFTLVPQIGHEASKTFLQFNNLSSFMPKDKQLSKSLGVRLDYAFKKFGGPYVGLATSRSSVAVSFSEPESGMTISNISTGKMQLRLEGGYKLNTKPIFFNKSKAATSKSAGIAPVQPAIKSRCGGYCTRYRSMTKPPASGTTSGTADKGWSVSIQPSVGMAFIPFVKNDIISEGTGNKTSVTYVAGNWNTALTAGAGFEFASNSERKFIVSVQYLKGIGNLNTRTVSTSSGTKSTVTSVSSSVSGLNLSVGIPISLIKKKPVAKAVIIEEKKPIEEKKINTERRCGYYSRYMKSI